jgi:hypothetical protein
MKKYSFYSLLAALLISFNLSAQQSETNNGNSSNLPRVFKVYNNPSQEKTDQFEITGFGGTTFTASNTADGTANSFNHNVQIILGLNSAKAVSTNFQLNFYSGTNNIQQAASFSDGTVNIYYPVALYDAVRTKLEQSFAAKKKVTVKVVQKPNGYREGTLVL